MPSDSAMTGPAGKSSCCLPQEMDSLSVVIPAFNEAKRIPPTLETITAFLRAQTLKIAEIIVVNDGSTDATAALVRAFAAKHPEIRLLENPGNRGKGYSVRHGVLAANGQWVLTTDADLSSPIHECSRLAQAALASGRAIAIGSRALDRALIGVRQPALREWCGRAFNLCVRMVTGLPHKDTQCGFKLFRRDVARLVFSRQQLDGFSFDVEDLFVAQRLGYPAVEVAVRWNNAEGTKVSGMSGLWSFVDLLWIRWLHADPRRYPADVPDQEAKILKPIERTPRVPASH
jgi:dolichyl-phosphate beta-glucosyltransferase